MPLIYNDIDGSWGRYSTNWPKTYVRPYDKYVYLNKLPTKDKPVQYGSYVFCESHLRVETKELLDKLDYMFMEAGSPSAAESIKRAYYRTYNG